jgi:hypothetical protein
MREPRLSAGISMTEARRAHQCHSTACDSPAAYEVHLHIRYGLHHRAIEHLKSSMLTCDSKDCRKAANDYLLSDHNKNTIAVELAKVGRLALDWPNAMVEFVPIGEEPWGPDRMQKLGADMMTLGTA